jgi:5-hydroxyisourate hydrolase
MDDPATISTHVLDVEHGTPATGIDVALFRLSDSGETEVGFGTTDDDGRISRLTRELLLPGEYVIEFRVSGPFFGTVALTFRVDDTSRSYHVPLLMAPYSIASYRGS